MFNFHRMRCGRLLPRFPSFFSWHPRVRVLQLTPSIKINWVLCNWCCLSKGDSESVVRMVIWCPMSKKMWLAVLNQFGYLQLYPKRWVIFWSKERDPVAKKEENGLWSCSSCSYVDSWKSVMEVSFKFARNWFSIWRLHCSLFPNSWLLCGRRILQ